MLLYNSREREDEHASTYQEGTREGALKRISAWAKGNCTPPMCWLHGPAGKLAFSFFFSRGNQDRSNTTKFFPTCAYQLAKFFPEIQPLIQHALARRPSFPSQCLD